MSGAEQGSLDEHPSKTFFGVRFFLGGFDPLYEQKVRSKLVTGGGVDVGQYSQDCTHVIVDKLVYDDSVCLVARRDDKTLVTGLWVDHSYDIGMPVDATSVLYRPLKDLNGIPGAKSLVICLTGYQRQDREDIMTMVGLIGAQFSKPLVANKVTHLICYKFEGEKYELAKKMKKIKLVNHQWLEDCLRAWEILSEANYNKSGHELEMEVEAQDSEEAEDIGMNHFGGRSMNSSPSNLQVNMSKANVLPTLVRKASQMLPYAAAPEGSSNVDSAKGVLLSTGNENRSDQASSLHDPGEKHTKDSFAIGNAICDEQSKSFNKTPISDRVGNAVASASRSAESSLHPDATKFSSLNYSRRTPRRSTPLTCTREASGNEISRISLINATHPSKGIESSQREELTCVSPLKRKTDVSYTSSKSPKMSHDSGPFVLGSAVESDQIQEWETASLVHGSLEKIIRPSVGNTVHPMDKPATLNSADNSPFYISTIKSPSFDSNLLTGYQTTTSEKAEDGNVVSPLQTYSHSLHKPTSPSNPLFRDLASDRSPQSTGTQANLQQNVEVSSSSVKETEINKTQSCTNLDLVDGGNNDICSKPLKRKMVGKKYLGSRPKLSTSNSANQKGFIYLNKTTSQNDAAICSMGGKGTADHEKSSGANMIDVVSPIVYTALIGKEVVNVRNSGNDTETKTNSMNEETEAPDEEPEAPDDRDMPEFDRAVHEHLKESEPMHKADTNLEKKVEAVQHIASKLEASILDHKENTMVSKEGENRTEPQKAVRGKRHEMVESNSKLKMPKERKRPLGETKTQPVPAVTRIMESKIDLDGKETKNEESVENTAMGETNLPCPAGKGKNSVVLVNKLRSPMEVEKENMPVVGGGQKTSHSKQQVGNLAVKCSKTPKKTNQKSSKMYTDATQVEMKRNRARGEPVCFILSGHKLQRKEFQQIIRHLKGRSCRDSHQWSYQATHFIVPDPIRRTEKLFAAAASGRWIIKTDYLTASNQAGKFLSEEPYEWHKNGLSEDGAINLEAPRKWRLLREKTGHGAFYGMRIIIYGECIAPSLDTLKRVVKAGDGTILATSPPYTRFLKSGVDFAIVSPSMPRVDLWVQEFLKHEIPCIVADYLVDYVCKPGYSLERHVLYKTNAWAERSFANMLSRSEEIVEVPSSPDESDTDELACDVCGSCDRGEVMLICGDESGSVGCGVGTHVDCCDPPLQAVPEEDWFCPKCSRSRNGTNPPKAGSKKKGASLSKRK